MKTLIKKIEKIYDSIQKYNKEHEHLCKNLDCHDYWCKYTKKEKIPIGCCCNCLREEGYFTIKDDEDTLLNFNKQFFTFSKTGFFNEEKKECVLPRIFRSIICKSYFCKEINWYLYTKNAKKCNKLITKLIKKCGEKKAFEILTEISKQDFVDAVNVNQE